MALGPRTGNSLPQFTPNSIQYQLRREGSPQKGDFSPALFNSQLLKKHPSLSPKTRRAFNYLSEIKNPEIYFKNLVGLGEFLVREGEEQVAFSIFSQVKKSLNQKWSGSSKRYQVLAKRADTQLQLLMGKGPLGLRLERQLSHFAKDLFNPISLISMVAGGLAYGAVRLGTFARLARVSQATFWSRGLGAHLLASTVGFGAEVSAFVGTGRGLRHLAGIQQDWSAQALAREVGGAALMLGALKTTGAGSKFLLGRMPTNIQKAAWTPGWTLKRAPYVLVPQTAMLFGIMAAHKTEEALGWRPTGDGAGLLLKSLVTLVHFNALGKILEKGLGPSYQKLQHDLHQKAEILRHRLSRPVLSASKFLNPFLGGKIPGAPQLSAVRVGPGGEFLLGQPAELTPSIHAMSGNGENGGKGKGVIEKPRKETPQGDEGDTLPPVDLTNMVEAATVLRQAFAQSMSRGTIVYPDRFAPSKDFEAELSQLDTPDLPNLPRYEDFSLAPGDRLGANNRYDVKGAIGEGGMGKIYMVYDTQLDRDAVIKIPHPRHQTEQFRQRQQNEVIISAKVKTGSAVMVYDQISLPNGLLVPVMEYVPGHDMATVLRKFKQGDPEIKQEYNLERKIKVFAQLLERVESTHDLGILHRDLKPDNIRITDEGVVRLMDFGIAKLVKGIRRRRRPSFSAKVAQKLESSQTQEGALTGTPGYIAPEAPQANGPNISNPYSQDIFALGVILYEWMTGIHPYSSFDPGEPTRGQPEKVPLYDERGRTRIGPLTSLFYDQKEYVPSFREIITKEHPPLFYELEKIARKAMEKDPKDRYQSAEEMRRDLLLVEHRLDFRELKELRKAIKKKSKDLERAWAPLDPEVAPTPEHWEAINGIYTLKRMVKAWETGGSSLITKITGTIGKEKDWLDGPEMIAEITWEQLVHYGDQIDPRVREDWIKRIEENAKTNGAVSTAGMREAVRGKISLGLNAIDKINGTKIEGGFNLVIIPLGWEINSVGEVMGNYREEDSVFSGNIDAFENEVQLGEGYYVLEVKHLNYAEMRIPLQITLGDVRKSLVQNRPHMVPIDLVPKEKVPDGFIVVQGGEAFLGDDVLDGDHPLVKYSRLKRRKKINTFLMGKYPVTIREYREFIEDRLAQANEGLKEAFKVKQKEVRLEEIKRIEGDFKSLLPKEPASGESLFFMKDGKLQIPSWAKGFLSGQMGTKDSFYWRVKRERLGWTKKGFRLIINKPDKPTDYINEALNIDQPIEAIPYQAAEAYIDWRSKRDGIDFRIPKHE